MNSTRRGSLYISIDDAGNPVGVDDIDKAMLEIKDRIKNNISPSTVGLFEISSDAKDRFIQIYICSGNQKPYYIRKYGMCPEGCYLRIGTSVEKMNEETILSLFQKRDKRTLKSIPSPEDKLTFSFLRNAYKGRGFEVSDNFERHLELVDEEKRFNLLGYLVSDQFDGPIQFASYAGDDVFDLKESKVYQRQSLLKTTEELLDFLNSRNSVFTSITPLGRIDEPKMNPIALRELVVNALVHNDYRSGGLPTFEEFPHRFEISSFGGLPEGFSKDDFLNGYSLPANPELIRIFRDLGFAERLGTGIRRVLRFYPPEIFSFSSHFLRVSLPLAMGANKKANGEGSSPLILQLIKANPSITRKELAASLGVSQSTVYRELREYVDAGLLKREGSDENGKWVVK